MSRSGLAARTAGSADRGCSSGRQRRHPGLLAWGFRVEMVTGIEPVLCLGITEPRRSNLASEQVQRLLEPNSEACVTNRHRP